MHRSAAQGRAWSRWCTTRPDNTTHHTHTRHMATPTAAPSYPPSSTTSSAIRLIFPHLSCRRSRPSHPARAAPRSASAQPQMLPSQHPSSFSPPLHPPFPLLSVSRPLPSLAASATATTATPTCAAAVTSRQSHCAPPHPTVIRRSHTSASRSSLHPLLLLSLPLAQSA